MLFASLPVPLNVFNSFTGVILATVEICQEERFILFDYVTGAVLENLVPLSLSYYLQNLNLVKEDYGKPSVFMVEYHSSL